MVILPEVSFMPGCLAATMVSPPQYLLTTAREAERWRLRRFRRTVMRSNDGMRTGGEVLVDQLVIHGVKHAFCVPGESYIAALDGMHGSPIALTVCRQEGG